MQLPRTLVVEGQKRIASITVDGAVAEEERRRLSNGCHRVPGPPVVLGGDRRQWPVENGDGAPLQDPGSARIRPGQLACTAMKKVQGQGSQHWPIASLLGRRHGHDRWVSQATQLLPCLLGSPPAPPSSRLPLRMGAARTSIRFLCSGGRRQDQ
jgi:hypothetical protein